MVQRGHLEPLCGPLQSLEIAIQVPERVYVARRRPISSGGGEQIQPADGVNIQQKLYVCSLLRIDSLNFWFVICDYPPIRINPIIFHI